MKRCAIEKERERKILPHANVNAGARVREGAGRVSFIGLFCRISSLL